MYTLAPLAAAFLNDDGIPTLQRAKPQTALPIKPPRIRTPQEITFNTKRTLNKL
ncbi:hypothetical protein AGABI2DRAFT_195223 [Agaricus bisporus var. bisporus H97]|uniref:hypothetical protein n=1 Tax=Agaricus bisporus var. bisporus (strain H97 / ATCC MYA-4626 / FGSC 10389) TaxID=936046 RepID=UPI00029F7F76|nr:hypothetical protein AGABI2DRAFT_195223 [Agaricus bisporus var. bisporus H97]EKV43699.1 hypothetical protein AGABI2DRAFT_195223 [Agaricus bisporus var. bisporus H97]